MAGRVDAQTIKQEGTVNFAQLVTPSATGAVGNETRRGPDANEDLKSFIRGSMSSARVSSAHVPQVNGNAVTAASGGFLGVDGLTHAEQRLTDGGNQFSTEPPDQAIAVGNGFVVEAVNLALRVRTAAGGAGATVSLNRFFFNESAIDRTTGRAGRFLSDPKAYYDAENQRWFVTILSIATDPATGNLRPQSDVRIAVSRTADPNGAWNIYALETTNGTGTTANHPGCPCFGDQPLIGADADGFYITTNEFPIFTPGFNGAQVYALSKRDLLSNRVPRMKAFDGLPLAEGPAYSLQPAVAAPGVAYNTGTAYFMSALDFFGTVDNRIAVWRLKNTDWLTTGTGNEPVLSSVVVQSQSYGQPPDAQQKPGPLPLAAAIASGLVGKPATEHLSLIAGNDDRMQQVMFDGENLWSALNTVVKTENGPTRTGAAYFIVKPSATTTGALSAAIVKQGYVSVNGNNVMYPSIAVNKLGQGAIAFTLVGPDHFPSAAYALLSVGGGAGTVQLARGGAAPQDGFTGYVVFGSRSSRWGDYSSAAVDEAGNLWFAVEYVPNLPRTLLANWGTLIGKITP
ncbi:MAG TPA: hypothetical protein VKH34_04340 [Vicinamibacterales bacterium]|nr:hypothetical protein [Vicinamibacterales bacterium]